MQQRKCKKVSYVTVIYTTNMKRNRLWKRATPEAVKIIRRYRLNRRGKRGGIKNKGYHQDGKVSSNLTHIKLTSNFKIYPRGLKLSTIHWRIFGGACRVHATPYGTQFFHFRIHFHRKVPASEVHTPP